MALRNGLAGALRMVRKSRNLTQEDFSVISSRTYMSSLERGIKSPTLEKIEGLASVMEIHPLTLITLAYMKSESKSAEQLLTTIQAEIAEVSKQ